MADQAAATATDVLAFWWSVDEETLFRADPAFDDRVRAVLGPLAAEARAGRLDGWGESPHGALALVILLDQVPRNVHRGTPEAFASDPLALAAARRAISAGHDVVFPRSGRLYFYLPFEHAEDIEAQRQAVDIFRALGNKEYLHYALLHFEAIARFGRFPHRNAMLGRASTPDEEAWLAAGGFRA